MDQTGMIHFKNREEFRKWLSENQEESSGIWLIFYKKETGEENIDYDSAVEEAICFGWIDGMIKKFDEFKYLRKFTPRRPGSKWSSVNQKRAEKMIEMGFMKENGLKAFGNTEVKDRKLPENSEVPEWVMKKIEANRKAYDFFTVLAPSYRKVYLGYVMDAKKTETQERRLEKVIKRLEDNLKPSIKI